MNTLLTSSGVLPAGNLFHFSFIDKSHVFVFFYGNNGMDFINVNECFFIHVYISAMCMYGYFMIFLYSQVSCYFVFKVEDLSEKILLQIFPKCSDSDELSINNGNGKYLLTC